MERKRNKVRIYLSSQGSDALVAPIRIGAVAFLRPLEEEKVNKLLKIGNRRVNEKQLKLKSIREQEGYLEVLEEDKDYVMDYVTVTMEDEINYGLPRISTKKGYRLISQFKAELGVNNTEVKLCNSRTFGNLSDEVVGEVKGETKEEVAKRMFTNLRVWYQYAWWVSRHLHTLCPFYNWQHNYGLPTRNHLSLCLYWGIQPELFRVYTATHYQFLYRHWEYLKHTNCGWVEYLDLDNNPPPWWKPPKGQQY